MYLGGLTLRVDLYLGVGLYSVWAYSRVSSYSGILGLAYTQGGLILGWAYTQGRLILGWAYTQGKLILGWAYT